MTELEKEPSIGVSYNVELPGKRSLVLQSFVERDCDVKSLNSVLDKLRIASERQFAFGMVEVLRMQLEQEQKIASDHAMRMAQVDQNIKDEWSRTRKGDVTLSARQRQEQQQAYAHAEESRKRIAKVKADIAEYEAKIGA